MEKNLILEKAEEILNSIRPYLKQDDGDVKLVNFEEDTQTLVLSLLGNCKDCPLSPMTLRAGIEKLLIKQIPEIRRIENE